MNVKVNINNDKVKSKVTNYQFGKFAAESWKKLIDPYTPRKTGELIRNVRYLPFAIHYKTIYSGYVYNGEVYIDPKFKVGGFYSNTYGWYSRPNVKKIPSGRKMQFTSAMATDHWDIKADKAGQKAKLYRTLNGALQNGNY